MSAFRFRLSTVLRLRENLRDECRQSLVAAARTQEALRARIAGLNYQLAELHHRSELATRPGAINVDQLLDADRYELVLRGQRQTAEQQGQEADTEVERCRQALLEADREVKTLEKLRQKQAVRYQLTENRCEINELDAAALQRHSD
ncbi:MAG TPA: flagellar export protein FliJ [Pirellulales bacterium]